MAGKNYFYDMKASWTENGKTQTRERRNVKVEAGKTIDVDFRIDDSEPMLVVPPMPKPDTAKPMPMPPSKPPTKPLELDSPYTPSPAVVVEKMLELAKVKEGDVVYDLGCGDGRIVIAAVGNFKAKKGVGIDIDPERIKESFDNAKSAKVTDKTTFVLGDILKLTEKDLTDATVVTLYLKPKVINQLMPMLKKLKPGTRIVSHDFKIGDWKPDQETKVRVPTDELDHDVYLWTVK
jgi:SAM-dependent methyltransferase